MTENDPFVIVGAGLAGAKAAEALREHGFTGRVILIGAESEPPYERPPLSKGLLLGTSSRDDVYVHGLDWYPRNDVDLKTGVAVTSLDAQARQVTLDNGERIRYGKVLLAMGSSPRRLEVPGGESDGVHYLRTLGDSERLQSALTDGARVVIVGAGWIGLEVAAAARQRGAEVTVVEAGDLPLQRVLGDDVAQVFATLHREHGVNFRFRGQVASLGGDGRVDSVLLADGTRLPADAVVVGIGIEPNVRLAKEAGLEVGNGIIVDESMRASNPDIYAAGDVANAYHPLLRKHIRVEHWAHALNSGPAAARAMLGEPVSYDLLPFFYTDQYDLGMEYSGYAAPGDYDGVSFSGDVAKREFIAHWTRKGHALAGMNVNVWDVQDEIQSAIRQGWAGLHG